MTDPRPTPPERVPPINLIADWHEAYAKWVEAADLADDTTDADNALAAAGDALAAALEAERDEKRHGPDACTYTCPNTGREILAYRDERYVVLDEEHYKRLQKLDNDGPG